MMMENLKRVTIFLHHDAHRSPSGKVFQLPDTMEQLLSNVKMKFQTTTSTAADCKTKLKLYTENGAEIDEIGLIRDDEILYASFHHDADDDPDLILRAKTTTTSSCSTCRMIRTSDNGIKFPSKRSCCSSPTSPKLNDEWIKLNIGGKIFTTTRSTIVGKEPESMLAKMFECDDYRSAKVVVNDNDEDGDDTKKCLTYYHKKFTGNCDDNRESDKKSTKLRNKKFDDNKNRMVSTTTCIVPSLIDEQGAFMIDRSPEYFEPLIGYLRHGSLIIDKHLNPMGVLEEAKFYGFYSLIPELEAIIRQEALLQNTIERSIGLAPLTRKDVVKAIMQTSVETRLRFQGMNLSRADLSRLDLSNINFKYAILRGANLQGATLRNCCLERADMSKCNLEGASLINCHMVCCNLEGSILRGSNMDSQSLIELTNLEGANLNNVNLEGSKMHRVNLRIASLKNANVQNCNLDYACLAGANLENCDLSGSDLNEVNLRGANLKGTRFDLIHTPLHMFYLTA